MLICGVFCFVINVIMLNSVQMPLYPFYFILYPLYVSIKVTRNGTSIVSTIPLKTAIMAYDFPEYLLMTGNVVSIAVAPPEAIPARFPKYLTRIGVANSVATSLKMFDKLSLIHIS